jgi:hypothetical protein
MRDLVFKQPQRPTYMPLITAAVIAILALYALLALYLTQFMTRCGSACQMLSGFPR